MSKLQKNIFNIVAFNAVWLLCVLGGSAVAVVAVVATIAVHMKFVSNHTRELAFIGLVAVFGLVVETSLLHFGVLKSPGQSIIPPVWLLMLWPLFATTINHSTSWFQNHLRVSMLAGGIAGSLTYITGAKLTDYEIVDPFLPSMAKLVLVWMVVFPLVLLLARKFNLIAE